MKNNQHTTMNGMNGAKSEAAAAARNAMRSKRFTPPINTI